MKSITCADAALKFIIWIHLHECLDDVSGQHPHEDNPDRPLPVHGRKYKKRVSTSNQPEDKPSDATSVPPESPPPPLPIRGKCRMDAKRGRCRLCNAWLCFECVRWVRHRADCIPDAGGSLENNLPAANDHFVGDSQALDGSAAPVACGAPCPCCKKGYCSLRAKHVWHYLHSCDQCTLCWDETNKPYKPVPGMD